jgi:monovalent cation:proton antiporter-2 (CPA2) family protein
MDGNLLQIAFVFLLAACVLVPISKLTGLGSVIGYLIAGVLIGPSVLGLINDPVTILHFAEFGVVMMLFLIGLELQPRKLWSMRAKLIGLGGLQVGVTTALIGAIALIVFERSTGEALTIGMALALSSTAIALQILQNRELMLEPEGESGFSVLLFQDVIVIAMIASLPFLAQLTPFDGQAPYELAQGSGDHGESHEKALGPNGPKGIWRLLAIGGVFAGFILGGRYLLNPVFRLIARSKVRETFTALALLLVVGAALLMGWLGLSAALGAFIGGVVLADSEYRHQLERDIEPFKALLLGLFFISVGMTLDLGFIRSNPGLVIALTVGLMALKFVILFAIGKIFKLSLPRNLFFAALLAQAGEFGFVIFSFALVEGAISPETNTVLLTVIALSMALTPLLLLLFDKIILPRFEKTSTATGEAPFNRHHPVLILGYGRIGQIVGRLLDTQGIPFTVIDNNGDHIEFLKQFNERVFYGDVTDMELLRTAGAEEARIIVITLVNRDVSNKTVKLIKETFPQAKLVVRARGRVHLFDLLAEEVDFAERETIRGALAMGRFVLTEMGHEEEDAEDIAREFLRMDFELVRDTFHLRDDINALAERAEQGRELLRQTLRRDEKAKEG